MNKLFQLLGGPDAHIYELMAVVAGRDAAFYVACLEILDHESAQIDVSLN